MATAAPFIAQPFDVYDEDNQNTDENEVVIWALDKDSKPLQVRVAGFRPYCYLELPRCRSTKRVIAGDRRAAFIQAVRRRWKNIDSVSPALRKRKFHYYQRDEDLFMVKVFFKQRCHLEAFMRAVDSMNAIPLVDGDPRKGLVVDDAFVRFRVWEPPSAVSVSRRFFTDKNLKFASWFEANGVFDDGCLRIITGAREHYIRPLSESLKASVPTATSPLLASFDIEAYSGNRLAFPDADKPKDAGYMVSVVFQRLRAKDTRERFVIVLESMLVPDDALPGCTVINVQTEQDLFMRFCRLLVEKDPDIITGYNIHGFDYSYLNRRRKWWNTSGRGMAVDEQAPWPSGLSRGTTKGPVVVTRKWHSGAYGHITTTVPAMKGRISIDLMSIVKRDFKLAKYSLDFVSKHFIGEESGKHDVSAKDMFAYYDASVNAHRAGTDTVARRAAWKTASGNMTRVAAYAIQDADLVVDLFERLNVWIGLVEVSSAAGVTVSDTFSRGQQCRIVSLLYDLASRQNVVLDQRKAARKTVGGSSGRAINDQGAAPQTPDEDEDDAIISYVGGFVGDSSLGLKDNVICLDFASLYPSIIRAYNICPSTLLVDTTPLESAAFSGKVAAWDEDCDGRIPQKARWLTDFHKVEDPVYMTSKQAAESGIATNPFSVTSMNTTPHHGDAAAAAAVVDEVPEDDATAIDTAVAMAKEVKRVGEFKFEFVDETVRKGILPTLVEGLVSCRSATRKEMARLEALPDSQKPADIDLMLSVLNQRQMAYKVTANSAYGFVGAQRGGAFPLVEAAMSITSRGRELIHQVNDFVVDKYKAEVVANDSVTGDTPVLIRDALCGKIFTTRVDAIDTTGGLENEWQCLRPDLPTKQYIVFPAGTYEIWAADRVKSGGRPAKGVFSPIKHFMRHPRAAKDIVSAYDSTGARVVIGSTIDHGFFNSATGKKAPLAEGTAYVRTKLPPHCFGVKHHFPVNVCSGNVFSHEGVIEDSMRLFVDMPWLPSWYIVSRLMDMFCRKGIMEGDTSPCFECNSTYYDNVARTVFKQLSQCRKVAVGSDDDCVFSTRDREIFNRISIILNRTKYPSRQISQLPVFKGRFKSSSAASLPITLFEAIDLAATLGTTPASTNFAGEARVPECILNCEDVSIVGAFLKVALENIQNKKVATSEELAFGINILNGYNDGFIGSSDSAIVASLKQYYNDSKTEKKDTTTVLVYDFETENHTFVVGPSNVLASNTDSSMFILPPEVCKTAGECYAMGHRLAKEATAAIARPPLCLEFEKAMRVIYLAKKKYAARLINADGSFEAKPLLRGIVLVRRDNCKFLQTMYGELLDHILDKGSAVKAVEIIEKHAIRAFDAAASDEGGVSIATEFEVIKTLGANYKKASCPMAVFEAVCKASGNPHMPGDRLSYIVVTEPAMLEDAECIPRENLGLRKRLLDNWKLLPAKDRPPIDMAYYFTNMLANPIDQLFRQAYIHLGDRAISVTNEHGLPVKTRSSCGTPMNAFAELIKKSQKGHLGSLSGRDYVVGMKTLFLALTNHIKENAAY